MNRLVSALLVGVLLASNLGCASARPQQGESGPGAANGSATGSEHTERSIADPDDPLLEDAAHRAFLYFWETTDPTTGLVLDRWPTRTFASIAAVGFGLSALPVAAERGWVTRAEARARTLATLRFFDQAPQGPEPTGVSGYKGFFYHFLDLSNGQRFKTVELSTIDTALLIAGAMTCRQYFDGIDPDEVAIRTIADRLEQAVDWAWAAAARPPGVTMGWTPEAGFHELNWRGYNEAMLLYVLALGSATHPIDPAAWDEFTGSYTWRKFRGYPQVNFGPLFGHQYSHVWIDFAGIRDEPMRRHGIDYFINSRRATRSQRAYAIANPDRFEGYGKDLWGISANDGPFDGTIELHGRQRTFHGYAGRGVAAHFKLDDGTLAPAAVAASVPFHPESVLRSLHAYRETYGELVYGQYGFFNALNPTLDVETPVQGGKIVPGLGWFDTDWLGIDNGPVVLMIENYRSGLIWSLMREHPTIVRGLQRAGFRGGWLPASGP